MIHWSTGKPTSLAQGKVATGYKGVKVNGGRRMCGANSQGSPGQYLKLDGQQNLVDYTYTTDVANGRRKVIAFRPLSSGDPMDYVMDISKAYYVSLFTHTSLEVTSPDTPEVVCVSSMSSKGLCKVPEDWMNTPPTEDMLTPNEMVSMAFGAHPLHHVGSFCVAMLAFAQLWY
jgi:hypothetical protein